MQFTQGATAKYEQYQLDTNAAPGENRMVPGTQDTMYQTLAATNQTAFGQSNVSVFVNSYVNAGTSDTVYMYQDAATKDVYNYNFGVNGINNNQLFVSFLGQPLDLGWVLQAKMNATAGTKWVTGLDTLNVTLPAPAGNQNVYVRDDATMANDTMITINGKQVKAKHAIHHINASIKAFGAIPLVSVDVYGDTYVAADAGNTVLNIVHPGEATGLLKAKIPGLYTRLITTSAIK